MDVSKLENKINIANKESFDIFYDFLIEENKKFNLTAITQKSDVFIKHFLDSIAGEEYFFEGAKVVEIGSGGGFPSIPLKIIRDDLSFTLIESTGKKCTYLRALVDKLHLNCVQVINCRAEQAGREVLHREMYDIAVARAVARLNTLVEYCLPLVKCGGRFIAYKGDCSEELEEADRAIKVLGGEIQRVEEYSLTGEERRTLVVIKKVTPTPLKYPRGQGKEKKCPIV